MGVISLSSTLTPHTTARAGDVMADLVAILNVLNGGIDRDNVVGGNPSSISSQNLPGSAAGIALADHQHTVQGVEKLAADPTTGNFVTREYVNTITLEKRMCINASGAGTWVTVGNMTATELVVHAAQHADGQHDPLPDGILTDHMFAAHTIAAATLGADTPISGSAFTTIVDLAVTTFGIQTLDVRVRLRFSNSTGTARNAAWRVVDVTASNATIFKSDAIQIQPSGVQTPINDSFNYTVPAGGARTLRLQAGSAASGTSVLAPTGFNSDATLVPQMTAVIR